MAGNSRKKGNSWVLGLWLLLLLYVILVWRFYLTSPLVWPDEALFADIAATWRETGFWGTDLWTGLVPQVERYYLQNPPGLFGLIALTQVLGGVSIGWMRLIPAVFGGMVVVGMWGILEKLGRVWGKKGLGWLAGLLVLDYVFLYASRLARPEVVVLGLLVMSLNLMVRIKKKRLELDRRGLVWAGLGAGLAGLMHPLAWGLWGWGVAVVLVLGSRQKWKDGGVFLGLAGLPVVIWWLTNWKVWRLMLVQFELAVLTKTTFGYWWWLADKATDRWMVGVFVVIQMVSWFMLVKIGLEWLGKKKVDAGERLVAGVVGIAWVVVLVGVMQWYVVYVVVGGYLALAWLWAKYPAWGRVVVGLVFVLSVGHLASEWQKVGWGRYDYGEYVAAVLKAVPDEVGVFLSAAPDPYFGFVQAGRSNRLVEFPAIVLDLAQYDAVLDGVEYVVLVQDYSKNLTGDYLERYVEINAKDSRRVEGGGYGVEVIKLVEKELRRDVKLPEGRFGDLPLQSEAVENSLGN